MNLLQQVAKVEALRASATDGDWLAVRDGSGDYAVHAPDEEWTVAVGVTTCDAAFIAACGSLDFTAIRMELERLTRENQELRELAQLRGSMAKAALTAALPEPPQ